MIAVMIVMTVVFAAVMAYVVYTMGKTNKCIKLVIDSMKDIANTEDQRYKVIKNMGQSLDALLSIEMTTIREAAKLNNKGQRK